MDLIDTHCHLNDPSFAQTLPAVMDRARAAGVGRCVVPAYDGASLERTAVLASLYPGTLLPAYGIHPWFVRDFSDPARLRAFIGRSDAVAVGEIGLDLSPECPPAELQVPALIAQLEMAAEFGLPVLIHCRKAHDQLYGILKPYRGRVKGVLHSYSGGPSGMDRFVEMDYCIAFSGSVTRVNARKYHRTAAAVPLERMLLETDAPSIATESTVASEVEPRHVLEVAGRIARIRDLPLPEVCRQSTANALRLFRRIPRL
jgi:TatD DNase family protein